MNVNSKILYLIMHTLSYLRLTREGEVRREHRTAGGIISRNLSQSSGLTCLQKIEGHSTIKGN